MANFLLEYLRHPRRVGAVAPSGKGLAEKMMEPIDFDRAECIVEYGPGTGSFTEELCRRKRPETRLVLIEQNREFFETLKERFGQVENLVIIRGTAAKADQYLRRLGIDQADYIVSGLPFASLPKELSVQIFQATLRSLAVEGRFITFQYTLVKEKFFREYFLLEDMLFEKKNLPPAFVFVCARPD